MLKTKRVNLRSVRKNDIENFLNWCNDPEITQYMYLFLPVSETAEERWIEDAGKDEKGAIFVIETVNRKKRIPIGICELKNINWKDRNAEIGIIIGKKNYWNKGLGTEILTLVIEYGFSQLNLHRLWVAIFENNSKRIPLFQKLGFQNEGCLRSAVFKNGKFQNVTILGLLEKEVLIRGEK